MIKLFIWENVLNVFHISLPLYSESSFIGYYKIIKNDHRPYIDIDFILSNHVSKIALLDYSENYSSEFSCKNFKKYYTRDN